MTTWTEGMGMRTGKYWGIGREMGLGIKFMEMRWEWRRLEVKFSETRIVVVIFL